MNKQSTTILSALTVEDVQLLQQGLTALQAALGVTHQPIPSRLDRLRQQLQYWEGNKDEGWPDSETMSAREVASCLDMTLQQVCKLGAQNRLVVAKKGHRGRGHSTFYTTESVKQYAEHRPHPGRQSHFHSSGESL